MDASEVLLVLNIVLYTHYAPYTKVEESFNLQACFDMLAYELSSENLQFWDHMEFPGVVPRSFLGAIVVSGIANFPIRLMSLVFVPSGLSLQLAVRIVLGALNAGALIYLKRTIAKVHGKTTSNFYIALQGTQFHCMYYASRTLPNFFAFPLTTIATAYIVQSKPYQAIALLTCASVIFRAEILILLSCTVLWHYLFTRQITVSQTALIGISTAFFSAFLSAAVDSYLWQYPVLPELTGFIYNVMQGKSSNWGTSPAYQYILDLVKLLLNPLAIPLIAYGCYYNRRQTLSLLVPSLAFCAIYSAQPHKEWRFIVYVLPGLTFCASLGASHLFTRRHKHALYKLATIVVLASIPLTGLLSHVMGTISSLNYPGGEMMGKIDALPGFGPIYLDVATCMTGSTNFLRRYRVHFERMEDQSLLGNIDIWNTFKYASISDLSQIKSSDQRWQVIDRVYGLDGIDFRHARIKKAIKLYLVENTMYEDEICWLGASI